jgi:hypothetical protein
VGIFVTIVAVAVLVGSLAAGLVGGGRAVSPSIEAMSGAPEPRPTERVRVQVLNASRRSGLAREATRELRDRGFDVLEFGNAPAGADSLRSVVLDRVGRVELARQVADAIRIGRVEARPDSNLMLDVTVILGRDWAPDTTSVP